MSGQARRSAVLAVALLLGCSDDASETSGTTASSTGPGATTGAGGSGGVEAACLSCGEPSAVFTPQNTSITEASGLVASPLHPGVLYVHNDSGDVPRFFAVGPGGADLGSYLLSQGNATDWEDAAVGPCANPAQKCLYFADVGDNDLVRASYQIYRAEEPLRLSAGPHQVNFDAISFVYPDGSHDGEAILVHPTTGVITLVTKSRGATAAYEIAGQPIPGRQVVATGPSPVEVGGMVGLVTGGSVHPDGAGVLLRTYDGVWYYPMKAGETVAQALASPPCPMPSALEVQGEAVAWSADGASYLTLAEGSAPTAYRVDCAAN